MLEELCEGCAELSGGGVGVFADADELWDGGGVFEALESQLDGAGVSLRGEPLVHVAGEGF